MVSRELVDDWDGWLPVVGPLEAAWHAETGRWRVWRPETPDDGWAFAAPEDAPLATARGWGACVVAVELAGVASRRGLGRPQYEALCQRYQVQAMPDAAILEPGFRARTARPPSGWVWGTRDERRHWVADTLAVRRGLYLLRRQRRR